MMMTASLLDRAMTPSPPSPRSKPATRRMLTARRDQLPAADRATAAAAIAARVGTLLALRGAAATTLALYAAKGSEVDTAAIDADARARGARVAYPRVVPSTRTLSFHLAAPTELVAGAFALREPAPTAPTIAVTDFDIIVLPGIAFDLVGGRLGWGRGYYDATLADRVRGPLLVGIGYALQLLSEPLPREPHDIPLDLVITDTATHAVARA